MLGPVLKEWYWLVIIGSIFSLAFAPSYLKARCPACKRRGLRSVDIAEHVQASLLAGGMKPFTTFYQCDRCRAKFMRERSGQLEIADDIRWQVVFPAA